MTTQSAGRKAAIVAWLLAAVYYFYQYTLRSAPAVMMPQLSEAFGLSALGVASKEANRPEFSGTATGVVNFLNLTFSAMLGPVFGRVLHRVSGGASQMTLEYYQQGFEPLLYGVAVAIVLCLFLKETGPAARATAS
jgi:hypothetical protein